LSLASTIFPQIDFFGKLWGLKSVPLALNIKMPGKTLKVVLVGDAGVGKTSMVCKLLGCTKSRRYTPTLGVDVHTYKLGDTTINIWDTAGKDALAGGREVFYTGADACVVVNSINTSTWVNRVKRVSPKAVVSVISNTDTLQSVLSKLV